MASLNLSPREAELLCGVIAVMKAEIVWPEVALKANFTTAKQARDKWPAVRDKIIACVAKKEEKSDNGEDATVNGEATPKKAAPKKRKAAGGGTPAKVKKTKKSAFAEADDIGETHIKPEADGEDSPELFS